MPEPPAAALATTPLPAIGFADRARTWWIIVRTALAERMAYRGDFALGTLMRFLPIITQIFLWGAIFDAVSPSNRDDADSAIRIGGYNFPEMVAYFLLTMVARAFSSMPGLATGIANQVRQGEIKKYLIQPIDLVGFLLLTRIAHKLAYYTVAIGPFALVFFLCRGYFTAGLPSVPVLLAFVASLVMGFLIGFFLEAAIGMISFWMLEINSLLLIFMLFSFFLSGHMFPLTLLPDSIAWLVNLLPLKYLAFFPAAIFLGKIPDDQLLRELVLEAAWLVFFIIACRWMYARGVRRYSGFGG